MKSFFYKINLQVSEIMQALNEYNKKPKTEFSITCINKYINKMIFSEFFPFSLYKTRNHNLN